MPPYTGDTQFIMIRKHHANTENRSWIAPGVVGAQRGPGSMKNSSARQARPIPARLVQQLTRRLLRVPTAPFFEHGVQREIEAICREENLPVRRDQFGNLFVRWASAPRLRPLVLAAHMDHPGFEILGSRPKGRWHARFQGGVPESFFKPGTSVRLMPGDAPAKLGQRLDAPKDYELIPAQPARVEPVFAVWDLEPVRLAQGLLHARGCDDVVGCASALAVLIHLKRMGAPVHVVAVLSRAEEVGFYGALALAAERHIPDRALVVSLETSKEVPPVEMGKGAILRVGDRASVFDAEATRFLGEVAADLQAADPRFLYQRALMSGGTCEATAYLEQGYQATGMCVALGHYHNCGPRERIAEEFVNFEDVRGMVRWLCAAALAVPDYRPLTRRLADRLGRLRREALRRLVRPPIET